MKFAILLIFIMLSFASPGQNKKGAISINLGFHQTDSYQKLFYHFDNTDPSYPTRQLSSAFLDVNLLYTRQTSNPKWKTIMGIGLNQKGLGENGMTSDGGPNYYNYKSKLKKSYLSIYGGLSYELLSFKKMKVVLGQLINPEIDLDNSKLYKKMPMATRTNLAVSFGVANNFSLLLTPIFKLPW